MKTDEIVRALRELEAENQCLCMCDECHEDDCLTPLFRSAANLIEQLTDENTDLRKEIEWKGMVIALAQKNQTEAEAERDALREKKRWIPVSEKAPEYDMPQLAMTADGEVLTANYAYGEWFDTLGQDVDVTHWMPLPEAPEGAQ